jgi:hypothetical protein
MTDHNELLEKLELALLDPLGRSDATLLDKLIADDFTEVGGSGRIFGKDEVLTRLHTESGVSFSAEELHVNLLLPTVGLVTYVATRSTAGADVQSRRCSIWRLSLDQWQMVYHQGTVT